MWKIFLLIPILLFSSFLLINSAEAQVVCPGTPCGGEICIENPLCAQNFEDLILAIANFIFWVATALAPLMIIIAAFYFLTSAGNPQQIATAKRIILYTVIGWGIILISRGIIAVIREILEVT